MLTEHFVAATESVRAPVTHLSSVLKDVGVFVHEFQPQPSVRQGFKKSSVAKNCLAVSQTHIFAAQAGKAVVNVYNREKNNQEATVPFPQKIFSLAFSQQAAVVILGTQDGRLIFWEIATGRITSSAASHIEPVTILKVSPCGQYVVSASLDSSIHVWSILRIVGIKIDQNILGSKTSRAEPTSTFAQHRSAVDALAIGHSPQASTNVVVSASDDKTCYIWNLESREILRTILLYEQPQCAIFDPVDRAVYFGSSNGSVQMVDIYGQQRTSILATSSRDATTPVQLQSRDVWAFAGSSDPDPAYCVAISYDSTSLITGHHSGCLVEWDVCKRRMTRQLSGLSGQSVTNIKMLWPIGFDDNHTGPTFSVPVVVKPRLDFDQTNVNTQNGVFSKVPADYTLHVQVQKTTSDGQNNSQILMALKTPDMPHLILDDAVQSLLTHMVARGQTNGLQANTANEGLQQLEGVQKELHVLRAKLAKREEADQVRLERHVDRTKRREALSLQKREAFFTAKKQGKNGNEAMKPFTQLEQEIDKESEDELNDNGETDVVMKD